MIIKRLTLYNFGSYFKRTTIEFPETGFFLISGSTGSGKTTILEGISFALFGRVPRYGDSTRLAEFLAKNESIKKQKSQQMEVELEFILNNQIYNIKRTIEFTLKYGEPTYKNHEVEFRNSNTVLAVKVEEYNDKMVKLLGMESIGRAYDTFTKSIFLPQNAFDRFLYLTPNERRDLIFDLLNLNIYVKLKEKIKEEYQKQGTHIDNLKEQREIKEKIIQEEKQQIDLIKSQIPGLQNISDFSECIKEAEQKIIILKNLLKQNIIDTIQETLSVQEELAQSPIIELEKYLPEIDTIDRKLLINRQNLEFLYKKYLDIQKEIQNIEKLNLTLQDYFDVKNIFPDLEIYEVIEKVMELIDQHKKQHDSYQKLTDLQERIGKINLEIKEANHLLEKMDNTLLGLQEQEKRILHDIEDLENQLKDKNQKLELKHSVLEVQKVIHEKDLDRCLVCYSHIGPKNKSLIQTSLEKGESSILETIKETKDQIEKLNKQKKQLENEIVRNQRNRASKSSEKEQKEYQLNQLKQEIEEHQKKIDKINEFLDQNQGLLNKVENLLYTIYKQKGINLVNLEKLLKHLKNINTLSHFVQKIRNYIDIDPKFEYLPTIEIKETYFEEDFEHLNQSINNLNRKFENIRNLLKKFKTNDWEYIQQVIFNQDFRILHEKIYQEYKRLLSIVEETKKKLEYASSLKDKKEKFEYNLKIIASNIKEIVDLNFGPLGIDQITEKNIIDSIQVLGSILDEKLSESNLNKILQEYVKIRHLCQTYQDKLKIYSNSLERLVGSLHVIQKSQQEIDELEAKLETLKKDFEILSILREDFEATGRKRNFLNFVYNTVFDMISHKANSILSELTEGRYLIGFKDDLLVRDNWYGIERNVKSLSGGEKFLTSLSIAMAISELLSTSRYKVRSMFIDEGFGTLDLDTLNDVIDYLENYFYNHSEKVLGIITHVEEIKSRFNYVIKVNKTKNGSEVQIISNV